MYLFGLVGLGSLAVSFLSGLFAIYLKFFATPSRSFIETPMPLLCVMTAVTGVMCILMGLLAEMIVRTFYESQGKSVYMVRALRNVEQKGAPAPAAVPERVPHVGSASVKVLLPISDR